MPAKHWRAKGCAAAPGPPRQVALGETFQLSCHQSAHVAIPELTLTIEDADYSPMQHHAGVEISPASEIHVLVSCGSQLKRAQFFDRGSLEAPGCGLTVTLLNVAGEDEASLVIAQAAADTGRPP